MKPFEKKSYAFGPKRTIWHHIKVSLAEPNKLIKGNNLIATKLYFSEAIISDIYILALFINVLKPTMSFDGSDPMSIN